MEQQELRAIAHQLSCPTGEVGIEVGHKMNKLNQFITSQTITVLNVKQGEFIVEIGPGNGSLSVMLLEELGARGKYLGIEMSEVMATEARQNLSSKGCIVDIVCDSCLEVDIEPEIVDGVMAVNILYFIDDLIPFFKKIITWMKKDGRAVFGIRSDKALNDVPFTQYGFNIRSTTEIKLLMKTAGFVSIESFVQEEGMVAYGDLMLPVDSVIIVGKKK